jgi:hypothetical protein
MKEGFGNAVKRAVDNNKKESEIKNKLNSKL